MRSIVQMDDTLTFLEKKNEGTLILKLNEIVRRVVKKRLVELEDSIVSIAVESMRDVLKDDTSTAPPPTHSQVDTELVAVLYKDGENEYYIILHKDYKLLYEKEGTDMGERVIGVLDDDENIWRPDYRSNHIQSYTLTRNEETLRVNTKKEWIGGIQTDVPDWKTIFTVS